jgi:hypothetical protein
MASREFTDSAGERWLVWDTRPTTRARLNPAFEAGWLTFESGRQLRRLAPTPDDWASLADPELERLCRAATTVERRRTPPGAMDTQRERRDETRP